MHEILTVQLGQRANYLATHFWNLQESYFTYNEEDESPVDHDVHFRPGIGVEGYETFTPRTLIYDLKGAFGTLRKHNALYELSDDLAPGQGLWDGKEILQQQTAIPQSAYQKSLDEGVPGVPLTSDTVRYWSDYNRVFYHPRSIVQLNDYELNSRIMPFENWNVGEELFNDLDKEHDLLDRDIRPFAEECDHLRALQLFTSSDDAWGGFAARYVDRLVDEYGKKALWVWASEDSQRVHQTSKVKRDMNKARSLCNISPQSTLYAPIIDPPSRIPSTIHLDPRSEWNTSALISAAVESVTLPTRLRHFQDFEAILASDDGLHKIFELQCTITQGRESRESPQRLNQVSPGKISQAQTAFDLDFTYDGIFRDTPHIFNQVQVSRGFGLEENNDHTSQEELAVLRRKRLYNSEPNFHRFHAPLQFPVLDSFPNNLFPASTPDKKINVISALTASSRTAENIKIMELLARRVISVDERENLVNGLGEIRESYETGWMNDSDFDDD